MLGIAVNDLIAALFPNSVNGTYSGIEGGKIGIGMRRSRGKTRSRIFSDVCGSPKGQSDSALTKFAGLT